jgi:Putative ER transporter, 6TM, N-terminal
MYQSDVVSNYFLTFGFFIAIAGFMALPVLPLGKFLGHVFMSALSVCVAAAVSLLVIWSALKARENTSGPESAQLPGYNSSQKAVSAIWLIVNTWLINALRVKFPTFTLPFILYAIVIDVACTQSPNITTMSLGMTVVRELLLSMLTGLALATGVNLIVVPITSRMIVSGQQKRMISLLKATIGIQRSYMRHPRNENKKEAGIVAKLKANNDVLLELGGQLRVETGFAEWDVAYGKLHGEDLQQIWKLIQAILIPT